ncbi:MAG: Uncharacterized protein G01um101425_34 [Candidatus Peregrinibacteria bacterium Gr01-1014_25]|nr:MAG: Uncharacterized protein G01um101425_34 [Candidatus Peregrinibacteria bacterium Gr01-1014_25]
MNTFLKGRLLAEGKTKLVYEAEGHPTLSILEAKKAITAMDDPSLTRQFDTKAKSATATTCRIFELLRDAGLPVAYRQQLSETEFLAPLCDMILLEVVARRYADGSILKRNPHLPITPLHRFHRLQIEFFLKTTKGQCSGMEGTLPVDCLDPAGKKLVEDPLILNPQDERWTLRHSKVPLWSSQGALELSVDRSRILPASVTIKQLEELTRRVFLVLEGAWMQMGFKLIDLKIEFGVDSQGKLYIADVIDSDNWRLKDREGKEVSKQLFRDDHPLSEVEGKYALVARLTEQMRIPRQAIVLWRGSVKDPGPSDSVHCPGVTVESVACSAHKAPVATLQTFDGLLDRYPDGGVILAVVGKSDGLGPVLAARSSWPIIAVCATAKEFPDDLWSSLRMPSSVPLLVAPDVDNGVLAALNILSHRNPAAYAMRRMAIETLDSPSCML